MKKIGASSSNAGMRDDFSMIIYLAQRGELHFDCTQMIFDSDDINKPNGVQFVFSAWDRISYHQALVECVSKVQAMESPNTEHPPKP